MAWHRTGQFWVQLSNCHQGNRLTRHFSDVTWASRRLKSLVNQLFVQQLVSITSRKTSKPRITGTLLGIHCWYPTQRARALSYYSDLTLPPSYQPMAAQPSKKAAHPLAKILANASCAVVIQGPVIQNEFPCHDVIIPSPTDIIKRGFLWHNSLRHFPFQHWFVET